MRPHPFLNIDLGELDEEPEALYAAAHLANIACGGHAGDETSMARALGRCHRHGTAVGAHPSYRDRAGFGRRRLAVSPEELLAEVRTQCARLGEAAAAAGLTVAHVKPHGALYHAANEDPSVARAVLAGAVAALGRGITFLGAAGGALAQAARAEGLDFAAEGFADRATRPDGRLVPRSEPGALLTAPDEVRARALALARSGMVDTICLHGDTPGAETLARTVRQALDALDALVATRRAGEDEAEARQAAETPEGAR